LTVHDVIAIAPRAVSRRDLVGLAAGTLALGVVGGGLAKAATKAAKASQKSVDYQDHPKAGKSCNSCNVFQPPTGCKTVEGPVQASGWCSQYKKNG
jgi:hypothetical protein